MREIPNGLFSNERKYDDRAIKPIVRPRDLIVFRTFAPRMYSNQNGESECSVLPEIIICQASQDAPVKIDGSGIIAKGPAPVYSFQLNPMWKEKYEKGKNVIYRFKDAFVPEDGNNIGDIAVYKQTLTGTLDKKDIPGEIKCSSIENRDITLRGQEGELEMMIRAVGDSLPSKLYDIKHPALVEKNKYYKIRISDEEMHNFVKGIACKIF